METGRDSRLVRPNANALCIMVYPIGQADTASLNMPFRHPLRAGECRWRSKGLPPCLRAGRQGGRSARAVKIDRCEKITHEREVFLQELWTKQTEGRSSCRKEKKKEHREVFFYFLHRTHLLSFHRDDGDLQCVGDFLVLLAVECHEEHLATLFRQFVDEAEQFLVFLFAVQLVLFGHFRHFGHLVRIVLFDVLVFQVVERRVSDVGVEVTAESGEGGKGDIDSQM